MQESAQKKVIIYGISNLSEMIFYSVQKNNLFEIACFTVDKEYINGDTFLNLKLIDFDNVEEMYPPEKYDMLAIPGGFRSMRSREKMFLKAKGKGYKLINYIDPKSDISENIKMGENNIVFAQTHLGISGEMGDNNIIRQNVYIGHNFNIKNHNFVAPGCNIGGNSKIGSLCFIGIGSTIIDSINIADETLVGAGSLILKATEKYSKYVGNPAKKIAEHKEEGIKLII